MTDQTQLNNQELSFLIDILQKVDTYSIETEMTFFQLSGFQAKYVKNHIIFALKQINSGALASSLPLASDSTTEEGY